MSDGGYELIKVEGWGLCLGCGVPNPNRDECPAIQNIYVLKRRRRSPET
jgi:hypothetical protein